MFVDQRLSRSLFQFFLVLLTGDLQFLYFSSPIAMAPSWSLLLEVDLVRRLFPLFREFPFKGYSLLIAWGFLVPTPLEHLVQFVPYGLGNTCSDTLFMG